MHPCGPRMTWDMELMTSRHPSYSLYANKHPHIKLRSRANLRRYVSNTSSKVIGAIMRTRENEQERERGVHAKSRAELRSLLRPKSLPPRRDEPESERGVHVRTRTQLRSLIRP